MTIFHSSTPRGQIVAQGIAPSRLEWKGIGATETLAKTANTKVVLIGNNKNGPPLISSSNHGCRSLVLSETFC